MSLNRRDLIKQLNEALSELLREKGYISFVDVLMKIGKLTKDDYEHWRFRRIPYLEQVITVNLAKVNHLLRTLHANAKRGGLKASKTAYMPWGSTSSSAKPAIRTSRRRMRPISSDPRGCISQCHLRTHTTHRGTDFSR
jgi:hypothetical protein